MNLVLGYGEVGRALYAVLADAEVAVDARDSHVPTPPARLTSYSTLHVCIPYGEHSAFSAAIRTIVLDELQHPHDLIVVHSTVPLGTTKRLEAELGRAVVHSPVRGMHPDLRAGLTTFPKYFGGARATSAAIPFIAAGLTTRCFYEPEVTEAIKLWDTAQYGFQIVLAKEIALWCAQHGLNFGEVYQAANRDYNAGYVALGRPDVVRPALQDVPGPIGGHCIVPNCALLPDTIITSIIQEANARYCQNGPENADRPPYGYNANLPPRPPTAPATERPVVLPNLR